MKSKTTKSVRLPSHVIPIKYKIHFEPDLEAFVFSGEEEILLEIKRPTKLIKLHSAEIEILKPELVQGKSLNIPNIPKISYKEKQEEVDFVFDQVINKGRAVLKLSFTGILNDKMRGFYRSKYTLNGKTYHMGTTQFESTDARRAFPSFDEPSHKAIFEVSFKIPSDRTVISNTIESSIVEHQGGYKTVHFEPSPKMSSYLLAFIIGHFESIEQKTKDGKLVRIFVTHGKRKQAEFAMEVAAKTLEFYSDYFKIKYPLPTLDLIAIPDFAAGAMENWGAVTYRETALLVDVEHTAIQNRQYVALVIAHELAHQWFGNLVTMEWWTHLWLNEGFASYMEYVAVDHLFPKWDIWSQFVYADHGRALELDSLKNTHPIEVDVNHPAEISEIFDEVSYSKGASVIRMLAEYLGETDFRNGLSAYLKKHSYGNASTSNLWEALEKVSKKPVKKMMDNWTRKPGYPVVSVDLIKNKLKLSQKRFFSSVFSQKTPDNTIWLTPISIVSNNSNKIEQFLLNKKTDTVPYSSSEQIESRSSSDWLKLNKNESSFIRVKYSAELLSKLRDPIEKLDKKLSQEDRFGIVRDAFVLSEAGLQSTDQALQLSTAYANDESFIVWAELATELGKLKNLLYGQAFYPEVELFVCGLFKNIYQRVGWEKSTKEEHSKTLLRSVVLSVMGRYGDKEVIKRAQELFKLDQSGKKKLDSDIRGIVYVLVAENGREKEYKTFRKMYGKTDFQEEKDRIMRALGSFKNKKLLERTLDFAFSDKVKAQDSFKVTAIVWGNPVGADLAWSKVKREWGNIEKKYAGGHLFSRFVKPAANFITVKHANDVEKFFKTHESKGLERTIAQAVEQIRSNAEWLKRDKSKIKTFLK